VSVTASIRLVRQVAGHVVYNDERAVIRFAKCSVYISVTPAKPLIRMLKANELPIKFNAPRVPHCRFGLVREGRFESSS
jgi:hypothetical protein